jgi:hypothetical protein
MPKLLILSARADEYARLIESARLPNLETWEAFSTDWERG